MEGLQAGGGVQEERCKKQEARPSQRPSQGEDEQQQGHASSGNNPFLVTTFFYCKNTLSCEIEPRESYPS